MNDEVFGDTVAPASDVSVYGALPHVTPRRHPSRPFRRGRRRLPVAQRGLARRLGSSKLTAYRSKRLFDLVIASSFLVIAGWWLLPLIAIAIRLDSAGPALYRQRRIGFLGEPFVCLKFRTMSHEPESEFRQATKDDPRVTRVGRFLRATNIDELPQFLNVLWGDMAVVGPRPHVPELDRQFLRQVPHYILRRSVRPGITGLAQVRGHRGETRSSREMANRVRMDVTYLANHTLQTDLRIIWWTVLCVLRGDENAY